MSRVFVVLGLLATVVVLLVAVLPINTLLDQRAQISNDERELERLLALNTELESSVDDLLTDEAVELIARRDYGLVMEGEEVFAVMPASPEPVRVPDEWPFTDLARSLGS